VLRVDHVFRQRPLQPGSPRRWRRRVGELDGLGAAVRTARITPDESCEEGRRGAREGREEATLICSSPGSASFLPPTHHRPPRAAVDNPAAIVTNSIVLGRSPPGLTLSDEAVLGEQHRTAPGAASAGR